jgi:baculoviral IAP repeat-containing protein 6
MSGFTRRMFLQVLLEDEKLLVAFQAASPQCRIQIHDASTVIQHPHFGAGQCFRTMQLNVHTTIGEVVGKISGKGQVTLHDSG